MSRNQQHNPQSQATPGSAGSQTGDGAKAPDLADGAKALATETASLHAEALKVAAAVDALKVELEKLRSDLFHEMRGAMHGIDARFKAIEGSGKSEPQVSPPVGGVLGERPDDAILQVQAITPKGFHRGGRFWPGAAPVYVRDGELTSAQIDALIKEPNLRVTQL